MAAANEPDGMGVPEALTDPVDHRGSTLRTGQVSLKVAA
jgi:hypothetical protein